MVDTFFCIEFQVIVKYWINDAESDQVVGIGARFGEKLPEEKEKATKLPGKIPNPSDCCSTSSEKVFFLQCFVSIFLVVSNVSYLILDMFAVKYIYLVD